MSVVGDSAIVAEGLSEVLAERGVTVDFLVECDTGLGRTGVQTPAEAAELAERVSALPGLRFAGLMTYPSLPPSGPWLEEAREAAEQRGLEVASVSGWRHSARPVHPRARRDHRAPRRDVRLRRPHVHRARLHGARRLRRARPRDGRQPAHARPRDPRHRLQGADERSGARRRSRRLRLSSSSIRTRSSMR